METIFKTNNEFLGYIGNLNGIEQEINVQTNGDNIFDIYAGGKEFTWKPNFKATIDDAVNRAKKEILSS